MYDAASKVVTFTTGRTRHDLDSDELLALALVRLIEIIGEAAKAMSEQLRTEHAAVPWRQIGRTRDRLIHGYYDVNLDIVWEIVTRDIPPLVAALQPLVTAAAPPADGTPPHQ